MKAPDLHYLMAVRERAFHRVPPVARGVTMLPEHSSRIEEIESTITWMKLLRPHAPREQKSLLMELHSFGEISDDMVSALFTLLNIQGE